MQLESVYPIKAHHRGSFDKGYQSAESEKMLERDGDSVSTRSSTL